MPRSWSCFLGKHSWTGVYDVIPGYGMILRYEICKKCEKTQDV